MATIKPGNFVNVDPGPVLLALESLGRSLPDPESLQVLKHLHTQLKVRLSPTRTSITAPVRWAATLIT